MRLLNSKKRKKKKNVSAKLVFYEDENLVPGCNIVKLSKTPKMRMSMTSLLEFA